ncbi:hypothetical protein D3C78_1211860 [compost metagenome]
MRGLCHEPGGGLAEVRLHLRHQRTATGVHQGVVTVIDLIADHRDRLQPGQIGNMQFARRAGPGHDWRAVVHHATDQQRDWQDKQQDQQYRHHQHRQ